MRMLKNLFESQLIKSASWLVGPVDCLKCTCYCYIVGSLSWFHQLHPVSSHSPGFLSGCAWQRISPPRTFWRRYLILGTGIMKEYGVLGSKAKMRLLRLTEALDERWKGRQMSSWLMISAIFQNWQVWPSMPRGYHRVSDVYINIFSIEYVDLAFLKLNVRHSQYFFSTRCELETIKV